VGFWLFSIASTHCLVEALIDDIEVDKQVALNCLQRPEYKKYAGDPHFDLTGTEVRASM